MKHLFVPYELAVKLKEKGFDIDCIGFYGDDGKLYFDSPVSNFEDGINPLYCSAPLYQQVTDWLRKNFNIEVSITYFRKEFRKRHDVKKYCGYVSLTKFEKDEYDTDEEWIESLKNEIELSPSTDNYYEALIMAIKESLKHI